MIMDWIGVSGDTIDELLAKRQFARALELVKKQLQAHPRSYGLRRKLAEVLEAGGRKREAAQVLSSLADEFALSGQPAKAIALLKQLQQIEPSRPDLGERLAALIAEREQRARAAEAAHPPVAPPAAEPRLEFDAEEIPDPPSLDTGDISSLVGSLEPPGSPAPPAELFGDFSAAELSELVAGLRLHQVESGEVVVTEGEPGTSLYLLVAGVAKAFVRDPGGHSRRVRVLTEGAYFGEISLLSGAPRSATVVAATACDLLELDRARLAKMAERHPSIPETLRRAAEERAAAAGPKTAGGAVRLDGLVAALQKGSGS